MKHLKKKLFGQDRYVINGPLTQPEMAKLVEGGMSVLFIGEHGTGKTQTVRQYCEDTNTTLRYYNASLVDPFIDFMGVPFPSEGENGERPTTFDMLKHINLVGAEVMFVDEINRADDRVMNSFFEIIQFRSVSGTQLGNIKAVFAAMNPTDGDYHVAELDPALLDRFDQIIYMPAKYDAKIIAEGFMRRGSTTDAEVAKRVSRALVKYVKSDVQGYLSPRKLESIGNAFLRLGHYEMTIASVPVDVVFTPKNLWKILVAARDDSEVAESKDTLAADGAAKASTMDVKPGGSLTKREALKILKEFRSAISDPGLDKSNEFMADSDLGTFVLSDIEKMSTDSGVSPATISITRSKMGEHGAFDDNNETMNALLRKRGDNLDRVNALMKTISPVNSGSKGYEWFRDKGYI